MMKSLFIVLLAIVASVQAFAPATPVFGAAPSAQVWSKKIIEPSNCHPMYCRRRTAGDALLEITNEV